MSLSELLQSEEVILLDGAMGTELSERGLTWGGRSNLDAPEGVVEIHREYAKCGCRALTTNTLTMNRIYIETHNVGVDVRDVNRAGAELARQAAESSQYVLGDISSTGQMLEPYGSHKESQFYDTFKEQAEVLAEAGVEASCNHLNSLYDRRSRRQDDDGQLGARLRQAAHPGRGRRNWS
ncbi:MAG: homocysteine S-methyltransferase family protein [Planctomycetota bacterium]